MQSPPPQGRGRATGELGRRPAAAGGIAGAEQGRAGREEEGWGGRASGWEWVWRRVRALHSPAPPAGHARLALPDAGGPPCLQGALPPPLSFRGRRGPEVSARVISGAELRVRRRTRQARGLDQQRPAAGQARSPWSRPLAVPASAEGAAALPSPGSPRCRSCTASGGSSSSTSHWWMRFWAPWGFRTPSGRSPWTGNSLPSPRPIGAAATCRCLLLVVIASGEERGYL